MRLRLLSYPDFQRAFFMYQQLMPPDSPLRDYHLRETLSTLYPEFRKLVSAGAEYSRLGRKGQEKFWEQVMLGKKSRSTEKTLSLLEEVPVKEGVPRLVSEAADVLNSRPLAREFRRVFGAKRFPRQVIIGVRNPFARYSGKAISGGCMAVSKERSRAFVGIEVGGKIRPEEIADTLLHELSHAVLSFNGYKNRFWPGSRLEERLLDWLAPHGFLSQELGLSKGKEPEKSARKGHCREWAERIDPLMREYSGGNVLRFLYERAGEDRLWQEYKHWYENIFISRARKR